MASSAAGIPSITPVMARVSSHAIAMMMAVCAAPRTAISAKYERDARA